MSLGVRGFNPIWAEFDLQGNIFDDTFYLFVLENTIPYVPATVYHDPDLNIPWTNPIRFLGNGTLPVDIYFESDVVYRLEFRQGPTQADPLIYEVNNYVAGTGGSTPVDTVAFASSNQITNPQFSLISFGTPASPTLTIGTTDPGAIQIGPGWFLVLAGTGTVTITQVPLNNSNANPSNAPYALRLTLTGWTTDSIFLVQRFQQNGMLWANKIVSSTITARVDGAPRSISASLVDSNSATLGTVLTVPAVNEAWNEFTGYAQLPATTNPNTPPAAYIDYRLALPNNIDIYVTSIQLVVQELPIEPSFEQDSINRQIDHTYNTAYPIVPVGTIIDYGGFAIPAHYLPCLGQVLSRIVYSQLFNTITNLETVVLTSSVSTFTVVSSALYHFGMPLEGIGIQVGTIINNIVGNTITMSLPATVSGPSAVRFFVAQVGDGSTTFNNYNLTDLVIAGQGGTILVAPPANGVGTVVGSITHTMTITEMPLHNHPGSTVALGQSGTGSSGSGISGTTSGPTAVNVAPQGGGILNVSGTPFSIVQPTVLFQKLIRFE